MTAHAKKTAVVTGASRGIGRAAVVLFCQNGWHVWALARNRMELDRLARETGCCTSVVELSEPDAIEAFCNARRRQGDPVDALVNNAAVMGGAPISKQSLSDWERYQRINVTAPWLFVKGLDPLLRRGASIVNVGSVASVAGFGDRVAYCASKHALAGMTKALAVEFAPRQVRVNLLCLGSFETPGLLELAGGNSDAFAKRQLLGRVGDADEAGAAIMFLASDQSSFMTGSVMTVDGGMLARGFAG